MRLFGARKAKLFYTRDHLARYIKKYGFQIGEFTYGCPEVVGRGEGCKLSIGRYCSISSDVTIFLGGNHRTDWISAYPFSAPELNRDFPEAASTVGHPASKGEVVIGNDVWHATG